MIFSISGRAGAGKDTVGKLIQWYFYKERAKQIPTLLKNQEVLLSLDSWLSLGIAEVQTSQSGWKIVKWATALRQVAAILLGMPEEFLYTDEFKQMVLPDCWSTTSGKDGIHTLSVGMTGREFLQKLGTDAIRSGLHPQTWVNALMSKYKTVRGCGQRCARSEENNCSEECISADWCYNAVYPSWIITDTRFPNELEAVKQVGAVSIRVNRPAVHYQNHAGILTPLHPSETALDDAEFDFTIDNTGSIDQLAEQVKAIVQSTLKSNENANSRINSEDNDTEAPSRTEE